MFSRMLCFGLAHARSVARSLSLFLSLSFPLPSCSVTVHGLVAKGDRDIVYSTLVGSGAVRDLEIAFQVCKHANRNLHRKRRDAFMRTHAHTNDRDFHHECNRARTLAPKGLRIEKAAGLFWIGGFQTAAQKLWDGLCVPLRIAYALNKSWSLLCKRYLPGAGGPEREPEREAERESTGFLSSRIPGL
jgi:hypothetical protein